MTVLVPASIPRASCTPRGSSGGRRNPSRDLRVLRIATSLSWQRADLSRGLFRVSYRFVDRATDSMPRKSKTGKSAKAASDAARDQRHQTLASASQTAASSDQVQPMEIDDGLSGGATLARECHLLLLPAP